METLTMMTAIPVGEASIAFPLFGQTLDPFGMVSDPEISDALRSVIVTFASVSNSGEQT